MFSPPLYEYKRLFFGIRQKQKQYREHTSLSKIFLNPEAWHRKKNSSVAVNVQSGLTRRAELRTSRGRAHLQARLVTGRFRRKKRAAFAQLVATVLLASRGRERFIPGVK